MRTLRILVPLLLTILLTKPAFADGVFVRFKLVDPADAPFHVAIGGRIHREPWYLPGAVWPADANKDAAKRTPAGKFTPWFDLKAHAGDKLHGRMNRSGGVAEFPNVTVSFVTGKPIPKGKVVVQLATAADEASVKRTFEDELENGAMSFLVSPNLEKDSAELETLNQMLDRHLAWAKEVTGGKRVAPKELIFQTSFYGPSARGAETLSLLGFNVVGLPKDLQAKHPELRQPGHTHDVDFGPAATRESIDALMQKQAAAHKEPFAKGVPFNFGDEVCCRPEIGRNLVALAHFRGWLAEQKINPNDLGVDDLAWVEPIETPQALREREQGNGPAARRIFYYTSRFRQFAATQRVKWTTESFHRHFGNEAITSTLVADHPYFSGTGLGMGMTPNMAWGGAPLAMDWFSLARERAVDAIGIEDWMGLQYMYGPRYTWEGFQLMGFQASMMRSGSRGEIPIVTWITPSNEQNFLLKASSALAQGSKHYFFWTFGPTAMGTENYWSDLKGAYVGAAKFARQLAAAEHIIAPGKTRKTKVALLYSISADLWQPYGYIHMLERRATYLALVHQQYMVDMLTEEDVIAGRLKDYAVLYVTDPNVATKAAEEIEQWVERGGFLYGSCGAGSLNEFNEPSPGLARAFGIEPEVKAAIQPGEYRVRGSLNAMPYTDEFKYVVRKETPKPVGVIGVKVTAKATPNAPQPSQNSFFKDGSRAVFENRLGKGSAVYFAACPGIAYLKDAMFVPGELKENYPDQLRAMIGASSWGGQARRMVELSSPVVEAGVYDAPTGTALVLANFTYQPIEKLKVRLPLPREVKRVRSLEKGELKFTIEKPTAADDTNYPVIAVFETPLGINDIILAE